MAIKIIVSYDGTDMDQDALALGRLLAGGGASLALAYVRHAHEQGQERERLAEHEAEALLASGAELLEHPDLPRFVVFSASTPEGLQELAAKEGADLIVFGSEYRTTPGHVEAQTSAQRLLEGGPVAIAIAPSGLHKQPDAGIGTVAAVADAGDEGAQATAESLAKSLGAKLATSPREPTDLLVVSSKLGTPMGRVRVSAAAQYLIETVRCSVLVLPKGVVLRF
ncbi:MAG: universal stress protein [Gaiellaceae bacterium]